MTRTTYSYTIATQITAGTCDVGYLHEEIEASSLPNFEGASTRNGVLDVVFTDCLSSEDKTSLDTLVQDHDAASAPPLIATVLTEEQQALDVRTIDYKTSLTSRLHKVVTDMYRGEVREVKYYLDDTLNDFVLGVRCCNSSDCSTLGYVRSPLGQPMERWTERTWYRANETPFVKKTTHKVYSHDPVAQMREGLRRRTNVIDKLSVDVLKAHLATTAVDPFNPTQAELQASYDVVTAYNDKYEAGITTFIRVGRNDFLTAPTSPNVTDDTDTWLDNSVTAIGYPAGWTIRTIILESVKNISEP